MFIIRTIVSVAVIIAIGGGCRRPSSQWSTAATPGDRELIVSPLLQLAAGRNVHCIVSSRAAVFYVSESDEGQDVVLVQPPSGIPRATGLSSANILAALGESVGGSGTIQSLCLGENDVAWFYFVGGKAKRLDACVGRFDLTNERLELLSDTAGLQSASKMGDALGLARGTLLPGGSTPRLLLRHSDRWIVLACRPGESTPLTISLETAQLDGQPLPLNQERYEISADSDDSLLVIDRTAGALLKVDSAGVAKPLLSLVGLPRELSAPLPMESSILFFAPDSEKLEGEAFDMLHSNAPSTSYPTLLKFRDSKLTPASSEPLRIAAGLTAGSLRLRELVPAGRGEFAAYDSASGTIVRIGSANR